MKEKSKSSTDDSNLVYHANENDLERKKNYYKELSESVFRFFEKLIVTSLIYYVGVKTDNSVIQLVAGFLICIMFINVVSNYDYYFYKMKIKSKYKALRIILRIIYLLIFISILYFTYLTIISIAHTTYTN